MADFSLAAARQIVDAALRHARGAELHPLAVAVLDARGAVKALVAEDGTSLARGEIAIGKASAALAMGMGSPAGRRTSSTRSRNWYRAASCRFPGAC